MNNIIIYGPASCGKTSNGDALRAFYGMKRVIDEVTLFDCMTREMSGNLILTEQNLPGAEAFGRVISFDDAMVEAGLS